VLKHLDKCTVVHATVHVQVLTNGNGPLSIDARRYRIAITCNEIHEIEREVRFSQGCEPDNSHSAVYSSKFLQWRPSCSSRASASFGPHMPAA
jgi:hypothetical protein